MIVRKGPQTANFTILSNALINDRRLSFEARGLLAYLISKPPHWSVSTANLRNEGGMGKDRLRRVMRECIEAGYMVQERYRGPDGRLGEIETIVYEEPKIAAKDLVEPNGGFTSAGSPGAGKSASIERTENHQGLNKTLTCESFDSQVSAIASDQGRTEGETPDEFVGFIRALEALFNYGHVATGERREHFDIIADESIDEGVDLVDFTRRAERYVAEHPTARADYWWWNDGTDLYGEENPRTDPMTGEAAA